MSKRESIARYNLIIKKLRRSSSTFQEISDYLKRESELQAYNFNVSKRTFQRDLDDIRSLFNIEIKYDFSRKVYFIDEEDQPEANDRILEAFDTFNALNVSDGLSKYILFEKRKPQGTENLYGLLHAIKHRMQIMFTYEKYWEEESSLRNLEPYFLKEFKYRWYLLGKDLKDNNIKSFALDRLSDLHIYHKKFKYPEDFNPEEIYKHCFGIISPNAEKPHEIILSFNLVQGKYIKSLPLHHSQEILKEDEKGLQVKLNLFITHDFIMELLSLGENVKVIKPKSLVNQLIRNYNAAIKNYELLKEENL